MPPFDRLCTILKNLTKFSKWGGLNVGLVFIFVKILL